MLYGLPIGESTLRVFATLMACFSLPCHSLIAYQAAVSFYSETRLQ